MQLALHKDIHRMVFPLPRIARVIPLVFAYWNAIKGGSDSITKLLWHNAYSTPSNDNQSNAIARILMLFAVQLHRLHQLSTAKSTLSFYNSIKAYRNAATERHSFHSTLVSIVEDIVTRTSKVTSTASITPTDTPPR